MRSDSAQALQLVRHPQLQVVAGQRALSRQARTGEIAGARLGARDIALDGAADPTPEIRRPARRRGGAERAAGEPGSAGPRAAAGATAGSLALRARIQINGRKKGGAGLGDDEFRLTERRFGGFQVLVRDVDLFFEIVEQRILVDRPPGAAIDRVERLADLPACFLVLGRHRGARPAIIGSDCACREQQCYSTRPSCPCDENRGESRCSLKGKIVIPGRPVGRARKP
jgi:hypothetical protein